MDFKRIFLIGPAWPYRGGLATFNERFAEELALDHEITLITFTLQYPNFLFPGKSQFTDQEKPSNLVIERRINAINPFNWIKVGRWIKKQKPDIVVFRYWMTFFGPAFGTICKILKGNKHSKVLVIADNVWPHEKRFFDKPANHYFLPKADAFITMSQSVLDDLKPFAKEQKSKLVRHPLYDNFGEIIPKKEAQEKLGLNPDFKYVLFFGFIRKYKGLDLLLEAFANSEIDKKDIKLLVAGEFYEDKQEYLDVISKHNLADKVVLHTEFIPNDKVNLYFSAVDIVAQTYHNATQSGVTQVAYHFNRPVLVTDVGGLSEMIDEGKTGYAVAKDVNVIAKTLVSFFEQNQLVEMQKNIIEYKKIFSWKLLKESVLDLLK